MLLLIRSSALERHLLLGDERMVNVNEGDNCQISKEMIGLSSLYIVNNHLQNVKRQIIGQKFELLL